MQTNGMKRHTNNRNKTNYDIDNEWKTTAEIKIEQNAENGRHILKNTGKRCKNWSLISLRY